MKRSNHIKTITNRIFTVILVFCLLMTSSYSSALAVTQSDLDKANKELEELRKQQSALSSDFASLTSKLTESTKKLAVIETQITAKLNEIDTLENDIETLSASIDEQYRYMTLRIKHSYEQGSFNMLDILLGAKDFSDFLSKTEYVLQMSKYDKAMLDALQNDLNIQKEKQSNLNTELDNLVALKTQSQNESANIKALMASTQSKINASASDLSKLEELALAYEKALEEKKEAEGNSGNVLPEININRGSGSVDNYDETDLAMLAAIIECEAGNQPYEGLIAVGSVVVNRVKDPRFPDSIEGVLFAQGQFTPVASGRFAIVYSRGAMSRCYQAAQEVLNGRINTNALYFHRYKPEKNEKGTIIGDHIFMYSLH